MLYISQISYPNIIDSLITYIISEIFTGGYHSMVLLNSKNKYNLLLLLLLFLKKFK